VANLPPIRYRRRVLREVDDVSIANEHNLHGGPVPAVRPFGIRVKLKAQDPFRLLLGQDWQKLHWYPTARERDSALADMSRRHEFSRIGDEPAVLFEKIERLAEIRSR
jgi:hypothetical protein